MEFLITVEDLCKSIQLDILLVIGSCHVQKEELVNIYRVLHQTRGTVSWRTGAARVRCREAVEEDGAAGAERTAAAGEAAGAVRSSADTRATSVEKTLPTYGNSRKSGTIR